MNILKKVLNRESFLYYSLFYLLFKYTFFNKGTILTYFLFLYAVLIWGLDIIENKGLYKFNGYIYSYLMCASAFLSCIIVAHKLNVDAVKGLSIFFVNFFMYLPMFNSKSKEYIEEKFRFVFSVIIVYSFVVNLIGLIFAICGLRVVFFGAPFGALYNQRIVTVRETANETGWFAIFSIVASVYFIIKNKLNNNFILKKEIRLFLYLNIVLQVIIFILTKNRSAIVGTFAFLIVFMFILYKHTLNSHFKTMSISMMILVIASTAIYLVFRISNSSTSDARRFDMIVFGLLYLKTVNPLFGSSYINLSEDLDKNFETIWNMFNFKSPKDSIKQLTQDGNAHNVFIQQIETNGLVGLIILILFFIYVFRQTYRFIMNIRMQDKDILIKSFFVFFIVFGFVTGNISWNIVGTMTCFVNLLFFLSISSVLEYNSYE